MSTSPLAPKAEKKPGGISPRDCHDILMNSNIGIFTSSPDGRFLLSANQAFAQMLGYSSPEELIDSITDIATQIYADPADRGKFIHLLEIQDEVIDHECRFRRRDGTVLWVSRNARAVRDQNGNITRYQGLVSEITERKLIEEELRQNETKFRALFENAGDAVFLADADTGFIVDANEQAQELTGYPVEVLQGMHHSQLHPPEMNELARSEFARSVKLSTRSYLQESILRNSAGDHIPVEISSGGRFRFGDRRLHVGVFRDITERKHAEHALRESEENFRSLFMNAPMPYQSLDKHGNFLEVNKSLLDTLGYSREELIGNNFVEILHPDFADHFRINFLKFICKGVALGVEFKLVKKDGSIILISLNGKVQRDEQGCFQRTHCIFQDITARRQAEETLVWEKTLLKAIIDNIPVMITHYDPHMKMLYLNREFEAKTGWKTEEVQDIDLMEMVYPDPDYRRAVSEYMERAVVEWREFEVRAKSGEIVASQWSNIRLSNGAQVGIGLDVTEQKRTELALRNSLAEKELLLREVHHRVKNNLAIISALLDMQRQTIEDPAVATVLMELDSRIKSIVLVHEHLYQSGNLARIDFQDYLITLINDLRSSLGAGNDIQCVANAHGIEVGVDVALPCGMIINELVINAIKHAFPGGRTHDGKTPPRITASVRMDNGLYRVVVADNGVGFPRGVDLKTSHSFGLRLVRMIVTHQLQGWFELDRSEGTSIAFFFRDRHRDIP